jgi:hypothetical protein
MPCIWNHSGMWNLLWSTGLTSFCRDRFLRSGRRTSKSCTSQMTETDRKWGGSDS